VKGTDLNGLGSEDKSSGGHALGDLGLRYLGGEVLSGAITGETAVVTF